MRNKALSELTRAESLLSNWRYLPGVQIKVLVTHLINALDTITSYIMDEETILERAYLFTSCYRLFSDESVESKFYETYFYLKGLLSKDIQRVNADNVRITDYKHTSIEGQGFFESLIADVKDVFNDVFGA